MNMDIENIKFYNYEGFIVSQGVYSIIDLIDKYLLDYNDIEIYVLPGNICQLQIIDRPISTKFEYYYIKSEDVAQFDKAPLNGDYSKFEEAFQRLKEKRKRLLKLNKLGI